MTLKTPAKATVRALSSSSSWRRARMPTYDIAGVVVDFPFEAYSVQLVYMEKVVLALEHGSNALLESPTGTGKTLCLLCAALGWRRAQIERMRTAGAKPSAPAQGDAAWAAFGKAAASSSYSGGDSTNGKAPRIIYASRTHSQLQQVVRELRRTVHRPKVCVLGSREQLCCHQDVSKMTGAAQTAACQALTAASSCVYHRKLQEHKRKHGVVPHPQEQIEEASRTVPDIEDFVAASKREELCPFYYARELQSSSDVLFLPYNYLLDPRTRRALNINLSRDVLVFDEAHNIEKVCADAASFNLSSIELASAVRELDRLIAGAKNSGGSADADAVDDDGPGNSMDLAGLDGGGGGGGKVPVAELLRVRQIVLAIDDAVAKLPLKSTRAEPRYVRNGDGLAELLGVAGIHGDNAALLVTVCEKCVTTLGESARFGVGVGSGFALQKLAEVLVLAFDGERPTSEYRLCVQEMPDKRGSGGGGPGGGGGRSAGLSMGAKPRTIGYWYVHGSRLTAPYPQLSSHSYSRPYSPLGATPMTGRFASAGASTPGRQCARWLLPEYARCCSRRAHSRR